MKGQSRIGRIEGLRTPLLEAEKRRDWAIRRHHRRDRRLSHESHKLRSRIPVEKLLGTLGETR